MGLLPGMPVYWGNDQCVVERVVSINVVLIRNPNTGVSQRVSPGDLRLNNRPPSRDTPVETISDRKLLKLTEKHSKLKPLLSMQCPARTAKDVDRVAAEFDVSRSTVYRWIKQWETTGKVTAYARPTRTDKGKGRLSTIAETMIENFLHEKWLTDQKKALAHVYEELKLECRDRGLEPPSFATFRRRSELLAEIVKVAKREGRKAARERLSAYLGKFPWGERALQCYQIDTTPVDVIIVDERYRLPIRRPYLTLVIDVASRMCVGFYLSLDPPSASSAGLALAHAILPKTQWLAERNISAEWPIFGVPEMIHMDNGKEFDNAMMERACGIYNIVKKHRPKGFPNCGPHIERLFRTFMRRVHTIPGTTFSNIVQRAEYRSDAKAILTLSELERWLTIFITYVYHYRPHRGLNNQAPIQRYTDLIMGTDTHIGQGPPKPVPEPQRLRLDFTPHLYRTIQSTGVVYRYINYFDDVLRRWIGVDNPKPIPGAKPNDFLFVKDPRDLSTFYFWDPLAERYYPIPYRDLTHPPISEWELKWIITHLNKHYKDTEINEDMIFRGQRMMREILEESAAKSKKARQDQERQSRWKAAQQKAKEQASAEGSADAQLLEDDVDGSGGEEGTIGTADKAQGTDPPAANSLDFDDDDLPTYDEDV